jgi:hypothetical protein
MKAVLFPFSQCEILAHQLKGGFQLFNPQGGLQKEMQRECNDWKIIFHLSIAQALESNCFVSLS